MGRNPMGSVLSKRGLLAAGAAAVASLAFAAGDDGDVKIHDEQNGEPPLDVNNEPHVCKFFVIGFNFDAGQQIHWQIDQQPPTGNVTNVANGDLTADAQGDSQSALQSLPDGHYKLFWNFIGENGDAKHKVFWVECAPSTSP